jgi:hypothetical protein
MSSRVISSLFVGGNCQYNLEEELNALDMVCSGCGARLNGRDCDLKCYRCGYEPVPRQKVVKLPERRKPKGWDQELLYRIYNGTA